MSFLDEQLFLRNGREHYWYVDLYLGRYRLQGVCDRRFYCGLFSEDIFKQARARSPMRFPFRFGSDRTVFERAYDVPLEGRYYVMVRISTFNPPGGRVHIVLDNDW